MILSDKRILEEMTSGTIKIDPFNRQQLGTNSYDVRLGNWFYRPSGYHLPLSREAMWLPVDFTNERSSVDFWKGPLFCEDGEEFVLRPSEIVLAHTMEVVGAYREFTTSMHSRSSIVRSCLSICRCGGVGDVGYVNKWTMEVVNHAPVSVIVRPGMRIAQIAFHAVGATFGEYGGKYRQADSREWSPSDMLPRLYLDTDIPVSKSETSSLEEE